MGSPGGAACGGGSGGGGGGDGGGTALEDPDAFADADFFFFVPDFFFFFAPPASANTHHSDGVPRQPVPIQTTTVQAKRGRKLPRGGEEGEHTLGVDENQTAHGQQQRHQQQVAKLDHRL